MKVQLYIQGQTSLASLPVSQQGGLPQGSMPQGGNPMQNMFLRPGPSPLPQGSLLHQFPLTAQAPHLAGQQQPGLPGLRPANFLQVVICCFDLTFQPLHMLLISVIAYIDLRSFKRASHLHLQSIRQDDFLDATKLRASHAGCDLIGMLMYLCRQASQGNMHWGGNLLSER